MIRLILIILFFLPIGLICQNIYNLEHIPYSHREHQYDLLDDFPFKDQTYQVSKDSIVFFNLKSESEISIAIKLNAKWKTWNIDGIFIDEIINIELHDLTDDSIPELILEFGFKEGISSGGNEFRNIMVWDYDNMICLFFEETYLFSFAHVWVESAQQRIYDESTFEVNVSFDDGVMIIKKEPDTNFRFSQGRYKFYNEEWNKLD